MTTDVCEAHPPKLDEHSRRETGNEPRATFIEDLQGLPPRMPTTHADTINADIPHLFVES
jgi:hypothetical protein